VARAATDRFPGTDRPADAVVAVEHPPVPVDNRRAGEEQQVAAELLGALLDADQERVVEVGGGAGEYGS